MRRQQPEKGIYEAIVQALRLHGVHVTRLAQARRTMQTQGTPDMFLMWPPKRPSLRLPGDGGSAWVEVKTPKGKLSGKQIGWHARAYDAGVATYVWRSVDDALAWLVKVGLRRAA